jgi:large subunit ribosomal protein L9
MKIILLKEVQGFGHAGDIKEAKEGYARNFLIPKGLAVVADKHTLKVARDQKEKQKRQSKKTENKKQMLARKINGNIFEIKSSSDESGTLYAGLDAKKICKELNQQGCEVEEADFLPMEKIKNIGEHVVKLNLSGNKVQIKLNIKS